MSWGSATAESLPRAEHMAAGQRTNNPGGQRAFEAA